MNRSQHEPGVLVCVTDQISCERLIRAGRKLADLLNLPLQVLSVVSDKTSVEQKGETLEYLYHAARKLHASMTLYFHSDSALMTAAYIKKYQMRHIVTGVPGQVDGFVQVLHTLCPEVPMTVVSADEQMVTLSPVLDAAQSAGVVKR